MKRCVLSSYKFYYLIKLYLPSLATHILINLLIAEMPRVAAGSINGNVAKTLIS